MGGSQRCDQHLAPTRSFENPSEIKDQETTEDTEQIPIDKMAKRLKDQEGREEKVQRFYPVPVFAVFPFSPVVSVSSVVTFFLLLAKGGNR
jgi:hypothetical protein